MSYEILRGNKDITYTSLDRAIEILEDARAEHGGDATFEIEEVDEAYGVSHIEVSVKSKG